MLSKFVTFLLLLGLQVNAVSVKQIPETGTPPSPRELSGITTDSSEKKLYIYGGRLEDMYSDFWEFDLTTLKWTEIYAGSMSDPGPRANAFLTSLKHRSEILLFGGHATNGPVSDVWLYDIENERVILT